SPGPLARRGAARLVAAPAAGRSAPPWFPALSSARTRYPVIAEPPLLAGAAHRTVANALPKLAGPITGAAGTAGGVAAAGGLTATPTAPSVRRDSVVAPGPSGLARPVPKKPVPSVAPLLNRTYVPSTATPQKPPESPVMKFSLTPVPSRLARATVPEFASAQKTWAPWTATPHGRALKAVAMKCWSTPVPSRLARPMDEEAKLVQ